MVVGPWFFLSPVEGNVEVWLRYFFPADDENWLQAQHDKSRVFWLGLADSVGVFWLADKSGEELAEKMRRSSSRLSPCYAVFCENHHKAPKRPLFHCKTCVLPAKLAGRVAGELLTNVRICKTLAATSGESCLSPWYHVINISLSYKVSLRDAATGAILRAMSQSKWRLADAPPPFR